MSSSLAEFISWPRNEKRTALFDSSSVSRYSYVMRITVTLHKLPNFLKSVQKGFTDEKFASSNPISYVLSLNFYVLTPVLSLNWSSSSSPHVSPPTPRAPPEPLQRAGSLINKLTLSIKLICSKKAMGVIVELVYYQETSVKPILGNSLSI